MVGRAATRSDNGWYLTELALQGFGIVARSRWDVTDHLAAGRLVRVLERHPFETFGQVYAVIPSRKFLAPRVRTFLDALTEAAKSLPFPGTKSG